MRTFVSYSSQDRQAVETLAEALRAHGIDPWLDKWEVGSADFVGAINQGLHDCAAGIIVFSAASAASPWVSAEVNYLVWSRVEEGKLVVPVVLDDGAIIPTLLRPLVRYRITDIDAIADALHNRKPAPVTPLGVRPGHRHTVLISLRRTAGTALEVTLDIDGTRHGEATLPGLPYDLAHAQNDFLQGTIHGPRRRLPRLRPRGAGSGARRTRARISERCASRATPAPRSPH